MVRKIQAALRHADFDAVLLTGEVNRRYATGFHSTAGVCYISQRNAYFFTDFRYLEAARECVTGFEVREVGGDHSYSDAVNACIRGEGARNIALEDMSLTYDAYRRWQCSLSAETVPLAGFMDTLRSTKNEVEVGKIVSAQRIAERAFVEILNDIHPGVTEKEIAAQLTYLMLLYGAERMSFDPIVVSGANSAKPHGSPTSKAIKTGDFVTMDFGCIYEGYCSDMTRTVAIGECTDEMSEVYHLVLRAQEAGIQTARAGVTGKQVDAAARELIAAAGYGDAFGHGFGHGVGCFIHEEPNASPGGTALLETGMVVTAEPGIYLAGKFGVRIEDMLCIKPHGCRNLTEAPKELLILK